MPQARIPGSATKNVQNICSPVQHLIDVSLNKYVLPSPNGKQLNIEKLYLIITGCNKKNTITTEDIKQTFKFRKIPPFPVFCVRFRLRNPKIDQNDHKISTMAMGLRLMSRSLMYTRGGLEDFWSKKQSKEKICSP
mmetsp:Transcript_37422/g.42469  ORF Transcript_37422/g.42469 Transcript_37422/m.42469 type:complete len:136 (+) Transcript_37422:268-675(+)